MTAYAPFATFAIWPDRCVPVERHRVRGARVPGNRGCNRVGVDAQISAGDHPGIVGGKKDRRPTHLVVGAPAVLAPRGANFSGKTTIGGGSPAHSRTHGPISRFQCVLWLERAAGWPRCVRRHRAAVVFASLDFMRRPVDVCDCSPPALRHRQWDD